MKKFIFVTIIGLFLTSCSPSNLQTETPDYLPDLNSDEFVLRETKKISDIQMGTITSTPEKPLNYDHFFLPDYIPDGFEVISERYILYPNKDTIDISTEPVKTEDNENGKFKIYKYNSDLSNVKIDTIFYSNAKINYKKQTTIQLDNGLIQLDSTDLDNITKIVPKFNTNDSPLAFTQLNLNTFDESYLIKDKFQNIEYHYFIGLKKLDNPISYYNFSNNKEPLNAENLSKFVSDFNYRYVIITPAYSDGAQDDIKDFHFIDEQEITKIAESIIQNKK